MDLVQIHLNLRAALEPAGITVYDFEPDGAPTLPCAFIGWPSPVEFNRSYRGVAQLEGEVFVVVARSDARLAQLRLAAACSTVDTRASLALALDSGDPDGVWLPALKPLLESFTPSDGAWTSLHVHELGGRGTYDVGSIRALGAVLRFRMTTPAHPADT